MTITEAVPNGSRLSVKNTEAHNSHNNALLLHVVYHCVESSKLTL